MCVFTCASSVGMPFDDEVYNCLPSPPQAVFSKSWYPSGLLLTPLLLCRLWCPFLQDPFTLPRLAPPISSRPTPQAKESSSKEASSSSSSSAGSGPAGTAPQAGSQSSAARKAVEQGVGREWCHTFDLSRSMPPEVAAKAGLVNRVFKLDLTRPLEYIKQSRAS